MSLLKSDEFLAFCATFMFWVGPIGVLSAFTDWQAELMCAIFIGLFLFRPTYVYILDMVRK